MEPIDRPASLRPVKRPALPGTLVSRQRRVSLCETLDRVLNKGAVIAGDIIISVADIDLLYIGLNLMVTSVETLNSWAGERAAADGELREVVARAAASSSPEGAPLGAEV
jgi:gas vesicle structural protein